jgi:TonB family protein
MIFAEPKQEVRSRGLGIGISFGIHVIAFVVVLGAPALRLPRPAESEYKIKIEGHEPKIVWYKLRKELPEVAPQVRKSESQPLRAEAKAKQSIVSSPANAPKKTQMVWTPAPDIAPEPIESPNIVAVKLPPKSFVAPSPPTPKPPVAKPVLADAAPQIQTTIQTAVRAADLPAAKLPPKPFVAPVVTTLRVPEKAVATTVDAPQIVAAMTASSLAGPKLPPKPFAAPPAVQHTAGKSIDTSATLDIPANSTDLNVAIVGLNPIDKMAALPAAPSPGAFSAGPVVRSEGATSEGSGKGLSVPDLFVRGPRDAKPDLMAMVIAAPTSKANLRAAMRSDDATGAVHAPPAESELPKGAARVSSAPDPRFNGREIFMMAIQMPQLTSYSGSWLMWYSDHTLHQTSMAPIAPPEAHRKVDPKYVASAVSERVEGRVTLACVIDKTGRVASVELLRGLDDRLNKSAEEALAKWEFYPATRNGVPVDVDVVVEIPFKLQPRVERR